MVVGMIGVVVEEGVSLGSVGNGEAVFSKGGSRVGEEGEGELGVSGGLDGIDTLGGSRVGAGEEGELGVSGGLDGIDTSGEFELSRVGSGIVSDGCSAMELGGELAGELAGFDEPGEFGESGELGGVYTVPGVVG